MLVQKKLGSDNQSQTIINNSISKLAYLFRFTLDESYIRLFTVQSRGRFSNPFIGADVSSHPSVSEADVINLHWINGGFLSLKSIYNLGKLNKPVVWVLHDMWAFTGGCHYNVECEKFINKCHNCPSLKSPGEKDKSSKIFREKEKLIKDINLTIVTPSIWLSEEAKRSELFKDKRIENIPYPIDLDVYKPVQKTEARNKLNLPKNKFLILFGSMTVKDERKGFNFLIESLKLFADKNRDVKNNIELIVFGSAGKEQLDSIPFRVNYFGRFKNESEIVSCYNSADVFMAPSLQDNLPNTVLESIACGVPVLGFNIGGLPDMVEHMKNGYLAELKSVNDLEKGIEWFYDKRNQMDELSKYAREKAVSSFNQTAISEKYLNLYKSLI